VRLRVLVTAILCTLLWCEAPAGAISTTDPPGHPRDGVVAFVVSAVDVEELDGVVDDLGGRITDLPGLDAVRVEVPASDRATARKVLGDVAGQRSVAVDPPARIAQVTPNDPAWASQWGMRTISAPSAWVRTTGVATQVIAVLDTGVNAVGDLNGRLLPGIDLVNGDDDPADDHPGRHGTHVATVAAALGNDASGIAGVCWGCRVLPVKVLDANGSGYLSTVAAGVIWAADHGATVINLSLGGPSPSQPLQQAIDYAVSRGVLVVAAAGNDGTTNPSYPAAAAGVIAVAASNSASGLYSWSTRGEGWVDVAAPGCNPSTGTGVPSTFCGTSSATPMVAGLLGLARSAAPGATASAVREAVESTTRPLTLTGAVARGVVDAEAAIVRLLTGSPPAPAPTPVQSDTTSPQVQVAAPSGPVGDLASFGVVASDDRALASVGLRINGRLVATTAVSGAWVDTILRWNTREVPDGWALAEGVATDASGNSTVSDPRLVVVDNIGPSVTVSSPAAGRRVNRPFPVDVRASDTSGVRFVLLAAGGRWVGAISGGGPARVMVRPPGRGRVAVVAVAVDNAGRIGISGAVAVNAAGGAGGKARANKPATRLRSPR
jgi:hypothetical protein